MVITYEGGDSFKISQGDLSVSVNPANARGTADVTLFSSNIDNPETKGFAINGPGEYEVKDISIKGFLSEGAAGKINTIYMVNFEGLNLCFLGNLTNTTLPTDTLESLENIDILFTPVSDPTASYKLAVSLEPSLIVPFGYTPDSLKKFLKEAGDEGEAMEKLVIKKKDLEGKEGDIVILKSA